MKAKRIENCMSNDERIAVLENTLLSMNNVLLDIKHEIRHQTERFEAKLDAIDNKFETKLDAMDKKFEAKFNAMDEKFETQFYAMDNKFETKFSFVDKKFDSIDRRFDNVDKKFDTIDRKFSMLENRLWSNFLWPMGAMFGLAGLIAHTQHWA